MAVYWTLPAAAADSEVDEAFRVLDAREQARCSRFRFERDRRSFALSHALVRRALSEHGETKPRDWEFEIGEHGRPRLVLPSSIHFSLSHTTGAVAVAISSVNVGFDIERVDVRDGTLELADHYFAAPEAADVRRRTGADKAARFFRYWTLKESYIKARALGLAIPLDGFWFVGEGSEPRIELDPLCVIDRPSRWRFYAASLAEEVPLALCVEDEHSANITFEKVSAAWCCS